MTSRRFKKRAPSQTQSSGARLFYLQTLRKILSYARALIEQRLLPKLPTLTDPARVNRSLDQISAAFFKTWHPERMTRVLRVLAGRISEHQRGQLAKQLGVPVELVDRRLHKRTRTDAITQFPRGTGIEAKVKQFTAENVALIKRLPQALFDRVEQKVLKGVANGLRHEEIAQQLTEEYAVSERHAALIARDQVSKFNGSLNKLRQENLGIDSFIWRTAGDERVRSAHEEFNGQTFSWAEGTGEGDDPAVGNFPGQAIQCRCFAQPVLDLGADDEGDT